MELDYASLAEPRADDEPDGFTVATLETMTAHDNLHRGFARESGQRLALHAEHLTTMPPM